MFATVTLAVAVAVVVSVSLAVAKPARPAFADTTASCKDLYLIGVTGSGQQPRNDTDVESSPQVRSVIKPVLDEIKNAKLRPSYEVHAIQYPALSTDVLTRGLKWNNALNKFKNENLPEYTASISSGVAQLDGYLTSIRFQCAPSGRKPMVVMVGYSQGAMVVHSALNDHAWAGKDGFIRAAVLIADPGRMPNSQVANGGTAFRGSLSYGACPFLDRAPGSLGCSAGSQTVEVAESMRPVTSQLCDAGDLVCDTSIVANEANLFSPAGSFNAGKAIHTNEALYAGYRSTVLGTRIGQRLVREGVGKQVLAAPVVPVGPAPVPLRAEGPAGQSVYFRMQGCPNAGPDLQQGLYKADLETLTGKVVDTTSGVGIFPDSLADGSPPFLTTRGRQLPGQNDFQETPVGQYNVRVSCLATNGQTVIKSYQPFRYSVTRGSQRLSFNPSTVSRGAVTTFVSIDPCPAPVGYQAREASVALTPIGINAGERTGVRVNPPVPVNGAGRWSQSYRVPATLAPGDYGVEASCGDLDYGYSGTLRIK